MTASFLFYDLETFGADPRRSRIAQFAGVRTDSDLNLIEEPLDFFVKPADDLLPSPTATVITGITPQQALRDGVNEAQAMARIAEAMSRPETCSLGYNSLRFDDEFVRHGLFRNFYDPYEREWRSGNSRWDLLDVMRLMHALRPDGIQWPKREDGYTSFKLEQLALLNGVRDGDAHEALSDVLATIGLGRLMRQAQPRLWEYALKLRDKRFAASLIDTTAMTPLLHISQRYPAQRMCAAMVLPLARHPQYDNRVLVFDLDGDPQALLGQDAEAIADRLYTPLADLPEGEVRVPLKEIHLNKAPVLVAQAHLRAPDYQRLGIDADEIARRAEILRAAGPGLAEKVRRVFGGERAYDTPDVDASLYGGFLADGDRRRFPEIRSASPADLVGRDFGFKDARLPELLFRYRARNWRESLTADEHSRWDDYRRRRLGSDSGLSEHSFESFHAEIAALRITPTPDGRRQALLDQLQDWGRELEQSL